MIDGQTRLAGLVGWPVSHSRSPLLHNHWCRHYRINGAYVPLPVMPGALEVALRGLVAAGFAGVNVTIPHKEEAYTICDIVTETARHAGAANTLIFRDGKIMGDCTDGTGFYASLCARLGRNFFTPVGTPGRTALILGAGGAARAIAATLLEEGFRLLVSNRTEDRARNMVAALGGGQVVSWADWPEMLSGTALLVNATSLGMEKTRAIQPDWDGIFARQVRAGTEIFCVADIVYTPLQTPLLLAAQKHGFKTADGLGMLLFQACEGFRQWFGQAVTPDEESFNLLKNSLGL